MTSQTRMMWLASTDPADKSGHAQFFGRGVQSDLLRLDHFKIAMHIDNLLDEAYAAGRRAATDELVKRLTRELSEASR